MLSTFSATDKESRPACDRREVCAGVLSALLRSGTRTWPELADAGLERADVLRASADLAEAHAGRVHLGAVLVRLEGGR